jgi:hypothetical protein
MQRPPLTSRCLFMLIVPCLALAASAPQDRAPHDPATTSAARRQEAATVAAPKPNLHPGPPEPVPDSVVVASIQRGEDFFGLPLCRTVHHGVVGEALELHSGELARQPGVQRVVHEQVRQHGADR